MESDFWVRFDNFDLGTIPNLLLTSRMPNAMPDKEIKTIDLVRSNGSIVVGERYTKKVVPVYAYILAPSRTAYEQTLDILKYRLTPRQRPLSMIQAGSERIYTASLDTLAETFIEGGSTYLTINFVCYNPFGQDGQLTYYDSGSFTNSPHAFDHVFQGFADVLPTITTTFGAVAPLTAKTVTIGNSITGQQLSITRAYAANEILRIDSDLQEVTVNGVEVDYSGFFPTFVPGTAYAQYSDNFTSRTVSNVRIEYPKKYF